MSWFDLTDEERKEWRNDPATKAFFESVRFQIAEAKDDVISCLVEGTEEGANRARRFAGRVDGFETAIKIMETDS